MMEQSGTPALEVEGRFASLGRATALRSGAFEGRADNTKGYVAEGGATPLTSDGVSGRVFAPNIAPALSSGKPESWASGVSGRARAVRDTSQMPFGDFRGGGGVAAAAAAGRERMIETQQKEVDIVPILAIGIQMTKGHLLGVGGSERVAGGRNKEGVTSSDLDVVESVLPVLPWSAPTTAVGLELLIRSSASWGQQFAMGVEGSATEGSGTKPLAPASPSPFKRAEEGIQDAARAAFLTGVLKEGGVDSPIEKFEDNSNSDSSVGERKRKELDTMMFVSRLPSSVAIVDAAMGVRHSTVCSTSSASTSIIEPSFARVLPPLPARGLLSLQGGVGLFEGEMKFLLTPEPTTVRQPTVGAAAVGSSGTHPLSLGVVVGGPCTRFVPRLTRGGELENPVTRPLHSSTCLDDGSVAWARRARGLLHASQKNPFSSLISIAAKKRVLGSDTKRLLGLLMPLPEAVWAPTTTIAESSRIRPAGSGLLSFGSRSPSFPTFHVESSLVRKVLMSLSSLPTCEGQGASPDTLPSLSSSFASTATTRQYVEALSLRIEWTARGLLRDCPDSPFLRLLSAQEKELPPLFLTRVLSGATMMDGRGDACDDNDKKNININDDNDNTNNTNARDTEDRKVVLRNQRVSSREEGPHPHPHSVGVGSMMCRTNWLILCSLLLPPRGFLHSHINEEEEVNTRGNEKKAGERRDPEVHVGESHNDGGAPLEGIASSSLPPSAVGSASSRAHLRSPSTQHLSSPSHDSMLLPLLRSAPRTPLSKPLSFTPRGKEESRIAVDLFNNSITIGRINNYSGTQIVAPTHEDTFYSPSYFSSVTAPCSFFFLLMEHNKELAADLLILMHEVVWHYDVCVLSTGLPTNTNEGEEEKDEERSGLDHDFYATVRCALSYCLQTLLCRHFPISEPQCHVLKRLADYDASMLTLFVRETRGCSTSVSESPNHSNVHSSQRRRGNRHDDATIDHSTSKTAPGRASSVVGRVHEEEDEDEEIEHVSFPPFPPPPPLLSADVYAVLISSACDGLLLSLAHHEGDRQQGQINGERAANAHSTKPSLSSTSSPSRADNKGVTTSPSSRSRNLTTGLSSSGRTSSTPNTPDGQNTIQISTALPLPVAMRGAQLFSLLMNNILLKSSCLSASHVAAAYAAYSKQRDNFYFKSHGCTKNTNASYGHGPVIDNKENSRSGDGLLLPGLLDEVMLNTRRTDSPTDHSSGLTPLNHHHHHKGNDMPRDVDGVPTAPTSAHRAQQSSASNSASCATLIKGSSVDATPEPSPSHVRGRGTASQLSAHTHVSPPHSIFFDESSLELSSFALSFREVPEARQLYQTLNAGGGIKRSSLR